ncbi:pilus assembly protein PilP [Aquabacterium sp. A7-Y]|uniref:pilus assembly protein PilP n=1 Tax=Aquabacterium sp. A7-Y TaxID=1349605 RepID=UPI00223D7CB8|nr:pilus assembly protein PilP [Aquabacterium sp. A7-Y]MCW7539059.1 pilus assembly protein PilP [Aquabacterium sp. A7-Y]
MSVHRRTVVGALSALVLLSACGSGQDELEAWMDQQKREVRPSVKPIEPPKKFEAQPYVVADGVEPFSPQKLAVALKQETRQANALLASEMNRRKEPLEAFPLDSMTMVGSVARQGRQSALLKVDELLYQVQVGNYLGQNYGRITRITETEIVLREIVQDPSGDLTERISSLQLQEKAQ